MNFACIGTDMKVHGFFYTDCVYEGHPKLMSLHHDKKSAYKEMIKHQYGLWEQGRDNRTPSICRRPREEGNYRNYRDSDHFSVQTFEILP